MARLHSRIAAYTLVTVVALTLLVGESLAADYTKAIGSTTKVWGSCPTGCPTIQFRIVKDSQPLCDAPVSDQDAAHTGSPWKFTWKAQWGSGENVVSGVGEFTVQCSCDQGSNWHTAATYSMGTVEVAVKRNTTGTTFGASAVVAAGAVSSGVHKADIKVLVKDVADQPVPNEKLYLTIKDYNQTGTVVVATLTAYEGTTAQDGTFTITYTSGDKVKSGIVVEVHALASCQDSALGSVSIDQEWDDAAGLEFNVPEYFVPEVPDTCKFTCRLEEGVPIDGHTITWYTREITLDWYWWNIDTAEEDWDEEVFEYPFTGDDDLPFDQEIGDFVVYSGGSENPDGVYAKTHTVYDYFDIVEIEGEDVWQEALVMEYDFAVYDPGVYIAD